MANKDILNDIRKSLDKIPYSPLLMYLLMGWFINNYPLVLYYFDTTLTTSIKIEKIKNIYNFKRSVCYPILYASVAFVFFTIINTLAILIATYSNYVLNYLRAKIGHLKSIPQQLLDEKETSYNREIDKYKSYEAGHIKELNIYKNLDLEKKEKIKEKSKEIDVLNKKVDQLNIDEKKIKEEHSSTKMLIVNKDKELNKQQGILDETQKELLKAQQLYLKSLDDGKSYIEELEVLRKFQSQKDKRSIAEILQGKPNM